MTANHKLMTLGTFFCEAAAALAYNQLTLLDRPRATVNELSLEQLAAAAEEENDLPPAKRLKPIQLVSSIKDVILEGKQLREDEAERYRALVGPISLVSDAAAKLDAVSLGSFIPRLIASIASGAMAPSSFLFRLADCVVFNALNCLHNLRRGGGGGEAADAMQALLADLSSAGYTGTQYQHQPSLLRFFAFMSTLQSGRASLILGAMPTRPFSRSW